MVIFRVRFFLVLSILIGVSLYFWTQSRYPDINQKSMMAESASVSDTIAMYPILTVNPNDAMWKQIAYTTVNWTHDNRRGMAYGVFIGGLFIALISYIRFREHKSRLLNTFYGFVLGTPLGVCVNCAAPMFKGVLQARQAEMAFAMMLSSPTMNVIVITMVFSLFPFYMALTKILFTLVAIFFGIPLISKFLGVDHKIKDWAQNQTKNLAEQTLAEKPISESLLQSLLASFKDMAKGLWFVFSRTVPLMLLAGFLGSVVSHVIPLDGAMGIEGLGITLVVAAVGLFLPVPMAFDVVLVNALYAAGLAPSLALVLLCTLGIFSSYSFMITWTSASRQWAASITGLLYALAVLLGVFGPWMHQTFYVQPNIDAFKTEMTSVRKGKIEAVQQEAAPLSAQNEAAPLPKPIDPIVFEDKVVTITGTPFAARVKSEGKFVKIEGPDLGLTKGFTYGIRDYPDPFWVGRGTASGDYNLDGWDDIAFGSDEGIFLYRNQNGRFIQEQNLSAELKQYRIYAVAFVDFNNDGWLDLFFSTFNRGNYYLKNAGGTFRGLTPVPNGKAILTVSPAFGDLNRDGLIDVFNGNMALGIITGGSRYGQGRTNTISYQKEQGFEEKTLDALDGETMASLISDFNGDGLLDVYQNNDYLVPDYLFLGDGQGGFKELDEATRTRMNSPYFSMSIDTGDLNNDLTLDYVATGTIQLPRGAAKYTLDGLPLSYFSKLMDQRMADLEKAIDLKQQGKTFESSFCLQHVKDPYYRANCNIHVTYPFLVDFERMKKGLEISDCQQFKDPVEKEDCLLSVMWLIVTNNAQGKDCDKDFGFDPKINEVCKIYKGKGQFYQRQDFAPHFDDSPAQNKNHAYLRLPNGGYQYLELGHPSGWTWSTKIADLDNDGRQDIFNAEGAIRTGEFGFNVLLRNIDGTKFEQKQFSWGLDDPFNLFSFTFVDYDRDGDLDVIGNSSVGPVQVYENRLNQNQSIAFAVKVKDKNTSGINYQIGIEDAQGKAQIREIKAGGGYLSFDAYKVFFGLRDQTKIKKVWIKDLMGQKHEIVGEFAANNFYSIEFK